MAESDNKVDADLPTTISAYPPPPLQYINSLDPNNAPPPITDGVYFMFGQKICMDDAIIVPLETQGATTKRLYPRGEYDHKKELKKINASVLVNFLDLIDVLIRCPDTDKRIEKCNDLATLFINFHHLINELRPHQARETLRVWLTCQKKSRIEIVHRLNKEIQKTIGIIEEFKNYEKNNPLPIQEAKDLHKDMDRVDTPIQSTKQNLDLNICPSLDEIMCDIIEDVNK